MTTTGSFPGGTRSPDAIETAFRTAAGHAVATLVRIFGDISLAEDAVQDAFVIAQSTWPARGTPPNPAGWIITTAKRRAIDRLRREERGLTLAAQATAGNARTATGGDRDEPTPSDDGTDVFDAAAVVDDRLRLLFTCCHPALRQEHRVALTLRLIGGLRVEEIARSFLVSEATMAKRLVRAKYKIKSARIPYRVPAEAELPERLESVLAVVYLVYNSGNDDLVDGDPLRSEAIRLAREVSILLPDHPETDGLLALLLLNEARVPARTRDGETVLLRDQDRSLWNREHIMAGHALVRRCVERDRPGPYQLQAAIQAVHCAATSIETTDWPQIRTLYDQLLAVAPTPVVALNRAIAIGEVDGPVEALAVIDDLVPRLADYAPAHAARAEMLRRSGRSDDARRAFDRAIELATSEQQRRSLIRERATLDH